MYVVGQKNESAWNERLAWKLYVELLIIEPILRIPSYNKNQSLAPDRTIQCRKLDVKIPINLEEMYKRKDFVHFGNLRKKTKHTTSYSELMRTERKRT